MSQSGPSFVGGKEGTRTAGVNGRGRSGNQLACVCSPNPNAVDPRDSIFAIHDMRESVQYTRTPDPSKELPLAIVCIDVKHQSGRRV